MNSSIFVIVVSVLLAVIIAICIFHTVMIHNMKKLQDERYNYCKGQIDRLIDISEMLNKNITSHNQRIHILEME